MFCFSSASLIATIMKHINLSIPACIIVENIDNSHFANGVYIENNNLLDCSNAGKPRYRHVNGGTVLWNEGWNWVASTVICDWSNWLFSLSSTDTTPDLATGSWSMNGLESQSGVTVTSGSADQCAGKRCRNSDS